MFYFFIYCFRKLDRWSNGWINERTNSCTVDERGQSMCCWKNTNRFSLFQANIISFLFYWLCQKLNEIRARNRTTTTKTDWLSVLPVMNGYWALWFGWSQRGNAFPRNTSKFDCVREQSRQKWIQITTKVARVQAHLSDCLRNIHVILCYGWITISRKVFWSFLKRLIGVHHKMMQEQTTSCNWLHQYKFTVLFFSNAFILVLLTKRSSLYVTWMPNS